MRADSTPKTILGVLTRKERWGLSWKGWLLGLALVFSAAWYFFASICPFLAVTDRVPSNVLVVEGWVPEYLIHQAAVEFKAGSYRQLFTTGGPWAHHFPPDSDDRRTWAKVAAVRLVAAGVPEGAVSAVPCSFIGRDRTYTSAVALREWLRVHNMHVQGLNIITEDLHARRTRFLFKKALGNDVRVGVIALSTASHELEHWWVYSESSKEVIGETIAYLYAALAFVDTGSIRPAGSALASSLSPLLL